MCRSNKWHGCAYASVPPPCHAVVVNDGVPRGDTVEAGRLPEDTPLSLDVLADASQVQREALDGDADMPDAACDAAHLISEGFVPL